MGFTKKIKPIYLPFIMPGYFKKYKSRRILCTGMPMDQGIRGIWEHP
jgi:hypothetical protein